MFINNFDPVAIEILFFEIRWYSLSYIIGILLGWYLAKKFFVNRNIKDKFDDYVTYLIIGLILGGRIGYVLIYNFNFYFNNPLDILKIWQGGMSFHGGVLGIIIASIIFTKKNNDNFFEYLDIVALASPVGIFFGRIANFINSELYGTISNVPWAVIFIQIDNLPRHPSQLYEAILEGLVLFFILIYYKNKFLNKPGLISALFLIIYSFFRFFIEFYRVPDQQLGYIIYNLSMGQVISLILMIIGLILFYFKYEKRKNL
ncbi:prolipoprotein diacylglyceryl transferase [Candidatus Pelagibacter sp.]|nr:prolipoprotein diacylglyceryl transferase [Candidatus Pelagibacter sp.]